MLTGSARTKAYTTGFRVGSGKAEAVVRPKTLLELWQVAQCCAQHQCVMIVQAANTGLTGGSTPSGTYDRAAIVISTDRIGTVLPIDDGQEAICLAGSTLTELEDAIRPMGRIPHSVIGSSCIGASVVGGICNNSGGALVRRGPAYTDRALFGRINEAGQLELINHLGRDLGSCDTDILRELDGGKTGAESASPHRGLNRSDYADHLRQLADTPARYNADPTSLFEAAGCAGKLIVFAVRLPTFAAPRSERTFIVGTNDHALLGNLRQSLVTELSSLPTVCEYMHRSAVELAVSHGRDICHFLKALGPARMPALLAAQKRLDEFAARLGIRNGISARISQGLSAMMPHPLPQTLREFSASYEHLLLVTTDDDQISPLECLLQNHSAEQELNFRPLTPSDSAAIFRVRFASAGATIRYCSLSQESGALAALDIALPRNASNWRITLPTHLEDKIVARAIYGHFLCHVFHLDYVLKPGVGREEFENEIKRVIEGRGGRMPAEHNFGHLYEAPPHVVEFYRSLDPTNSLNPGIGKTSKKHSWA